MLGLSLGMVVESSVAVLLAVTIGYCMVFNRRLKRLHGDREALGKMVADLVQSTTLANFQAWHDGGYTEGQIINAMLTAAGITTGTSVDAGLIRMDWAWLDDESVLEELWALAATLRLEDWLTQSEDVRSLGPAFAAVDTTRFSAGLRERFLRVWERAVRLDERDAHGGQAKRLGGLQATEAAADDDDVRVRRHAVDTRVPAGGRNRARVSMRLSSSRSFQGLRKMPYKPW